MGMNIGKVGRLCGYENERRRGRSKAGVWPEYAREEIRVGKMCGINNKQ